MLLTRELGRVTGRRQAITLSDDGSHDMQLLMPEVDVSFLQANNNLADDHNILARLGPPICCPRARELLHREGMQGLCCCAFYMTRSAQPSKA